MRDPQLLTLKNRLQILLFGPMIFERGRGLLVTDEERVSLR